MGRKGPATFSRREREIMDALYHLGEASVTDVLRQVPDSPSYDAVRLTLGVLEEKGHVTHRKDGRRYIYRPTVSRRDASNSALRRLMATYFRGSPHEAVLAMLDASAGKMSDDELAEIARRIRHARDRDEGVD